MSNILRNAAIEFFGRFDHAFATFSGREVAQRYQHPYLAIRADGQTTAFLTPADIADYFQALLDDYHARGCRSCQHKDLDLVKLGQTCALGTVTWTLYDASGDAVTSWRESYNLVLIDGAMKVAASIDHA